MRHDITDEIAQMATRMNDDPGCRADPGFMPPDVAGAVWAITRLTPYTQAEVERMVVHARRPHLSAAPPILGGGSPLAVPAVQGGAAPTAPVPGALLPPVISPDEIIGQMDMGAGVFWPVTKLGDDPTPADMTKPPAQETTDSMAHAQRVGSAEHREVYAAIDPEELAEIEREMEEARQRGNVYPDERAEPTVAIEHS